MEFIYDFFLHQRDKFALFFDAFHGIWDQGERCLMVFKIIGLLKNGMECDGMGWNEMDGMMGWNAMGLMGWGFNI